MLFESGFQMWQERRKNHDYCSLIAGQKSQPALKKIPDQNKFAEK